MQYIDSAAEVLLCLVLISFAFSVIKSTRLASPHRFWLALALLFIAVTAAFGAVRFAGELSVVPIHNLLSQLSTQVAMVVYVCLLPVILISYTDSEASACDRRGQLDELKIARAGIALLLIGLLIAVARGLMSISLPSLFTDIVIFLGMVLFWLQVRMKMLAVVATLCLLLVPLTTLLPVDDDIHMALFHLFLAVHFGLVRWAVFSHKNHTNPAHLSKIDLQSKVNHQRGVL